MNDKPTERSEGPQSKILILTESVAVNSHADLRDRRGIHDFFSASNGFCGYLWLSIVLKVSFLE